MNPLELRTKIFTLLEKANVADVTLIPPTPGQPLMIEVEVPDPYSADGATRRYRVSVEEM